MKKFTKRFLSVISAAALVATTALSAVASPGGHTHSGGTSLGGKVSGDATEKDNTYTITLTYPKEGDTTYNFDETNSHYGAYQIFSGTVKGKTTDGPLDMSKPENNKLPITDIKWGNAFGDFRKDDTKKSILEFVYSLATASTGDYGYAFKGFTDFAGFFTEGKLNSDYTTGEVVVGSTGFVSGDLTTVDFDKLAVAVADVLAKPAHVDDHEWLQAFTDILGGYAAGGAGGYLNKAYATQFYEGSVNDDDHSKYTIYVPAGYYMVRDLSTIEEADTSHAFSARMLFVANNVTQILKVDVPTLDKEILRGTAAAGDAAYETDAAGVGDVVHFQLKGTLPSNYDLYLGGYQYTFIDTLSDGLDLVQYDTPHDDYDSDASTYVKVTVIGLFKQVDDGVWEWDSTAKQTINVPYEEISDDTVKHHHLTTTPTKDDESKNNYDTTYDPATRELKVKFTCLGEIRITSGSEIYRLGYDADSEVSSAIYVDYYAKVNENAVIKPKVDDNFNGNYNTAQIEYSDNPQAYADTDKTVTERATVYTFGLNIIKIDAAAFLRNDGKDDVAGVKLDGAKFVIVRPNPSDATKYQIAKVTKFDKVTGTPAATAPARSFDDTYYSIDEWYDLPTTETNLQNNIDKFFDTELGGSKPRKSDYEVETADGGKLLISGLNDGVTYTIVETVTPGKDGEYAKIDPFTVTLTAAQDGNEYNGRLSTAESAQAVTGDEAFSYNKPVKITDTFGAKDDGSAGMFVANFKYEDLPSTGGIGVYIYYIAGGCVLVAAAVLFYLSSRKKSGKKSA